MQVVICGASGNVGTALLRALQQRHPDWTITGVCRRPPHPGVAPYDGVRWVPVDLTTATAVDQLAVAMRGAAAVVHLAWAIAPSHDVRFLTQVNVEGSRRVVEAVRAARVGHLVYASSVGTYRGVPERGLAKRHVAEDWPADGIPSSLYSRQKAAVEALLDRVEADIRASDTPGAPAITRIRPGLVLHGAAGSEVARYFIGSALPAALLRRVPLVPLPREIVASAVHADDVATAIVTILERRAAGSFNLAADDPITPAALAGALGGKPVAVPAATTRTLVDLSWRAHLQPTDAGWLDMAYATPLLDTGRAKRDLGWAPKHRAADALRELVRGMASGAGTASPALAPRSAGRDLLPNRLRMRA